MECRSSCTEAEKTRLELIVSRRGGEERQKFVLFNFKFNFPTTNSLNRSRIQTSVEVDDEA